MKIQLILFILSNTKKKSLQWIYMRLTLEPTVDTRNIKIDRVALPRGRYRTGTGTEPMKPSPKHKLGR
jgi:hypothetical protein